MSRKKKHILDLDLTDLGVGPPSGINASALGESVEQFGRVTSGVQSLRRRANLTKEAATVKLNPTIPSVEKVMSRFQRALATYLGKYPEAIINLWAPDINSALLNLIVPAIADYTPKDAEADIPNLANVVQTGNTARILDFVSEVYSLGAVRTEIHALLVDPNARFMVLEYVGDVPTDQDQGRGEWEAALKGLKPLVNRLDLMNKRIILVSMEPLPFPKDIHARSVGVDELGGIDREDMLMLSVATPLADHAPDAEGFSGLQQLAAEHGFDDIYGSTITYKAFDPARDRPILEPHELEESIKAAARQLRSFPLLQQARAALLRAIEDSVDSYPDPNDPEGKPVPMINVSTLRRKLRSEGGESGYGKGVSVTYGGDDDKGTQRDDYVWYNKDARQMLRFVEDFAQGDKPNKDYKRIPSKKLRRYDSLKDMPTEEALLYLNEDLDAKTQMYGEDSPEARAVQHQIDDLAQQKSLQTSDDDAQQNLTPEQLAMLQEEGYGSVVDNDPPDQNMFLLQGTPGVGKSFMIQALTNAAYRADPTGQWKSIEINLTQMIENPEYGGQKLKALQSAMDIVEGENHAIIMLDELPDFLAGSVGDSGQDSGVVRPADPDAATLGNFLKQKLTDGPFRRHLKQNKVVLVAAGNIGRMGNIEPALLSRFQLKTIEEPSSTNTTAIADMLEVMYRKATGKSLYRTVYITWPNIGAPSSPLTGDKEDRIEQMEEVGRERVEKVVEVGITNAQRQYTYQFVGVSGRTLNDAVKNLVSGVQAKAVTTKQQMSNDMFGDEASQAAVQAFYSHLTPQSVVAMIEEAGRVHARNVEQDREQGGGEYGSQIPQNMAEIVPAERIADLDTYVFANQAQVDLLRHVERFAADGAPYEPYEIDYMNDVGLREPFGDTAANESVDEGDAQTDESDMDVSVFKRKDRSSPLSKALVPKVQSSVPNATVLWGEPGVGKTELGKALAKAAKRVDPGNPWAAVILDLSRATSRWNDQMGEVISKLLGTLETMRYSVVVFDELARSLSDTSTHDPEWSNPNITSAQNKINSMIQTFLGSQDRLQKLAANKVFVMITGNIEDKKNVTGPLADRLNHQVVRAPNPKDTRLQSRFLNSAFLRSDPLSAELDEGRINLFQVAERAWKVPGDTGVEKIASLFDQAIAQLESEGNFTPFAGRQYDNIIRQLTDRGKATAERAQRQAQKSVGTQLDKLGPEAKADALREIYTKTLLMAFSPSKVYEQILAIGRSRRLSRMDDELRETLPETGNSTPEAEVETPAATQTKAKPKAR